MKRERATVRDESALLVTAAFTCARCARHRLGQYAAASPEGVVCSGGPRCQPRACRCLCCDEHCDLKACKFLGQRSEVGSR